MTRIILLSVMYNCISRISCSTFSTLKLEKLFRCCCFYAETNGLSALFVHIKLTAYEKKIHGCIPATIIIIQQQPDSPGQ